MTKLTQDELNKIREIRIHTLLNLPDNGRKITMKCPFHQERTPGGSFFLYPDNSFFCFGCNTNGKGAITFTMKLGSNFMEALQELIKYI